MSKIVVRCPAKVNLTFEILGLLADGYHEVETLLQSIDLQDTLTFQLEKGETFSASLSCDQILQAVPLDSTNLICKAAQLFVAESDNAGVRMTVHIDKQIPVAAGLAGGSADAAGTLQALNHYFNHPFSPEQLLAMAAKLGADVPFCLTGGSKIGTRRGDVLCEVAAESIILHMAIVKPREIAIATPWVYKAYDEYLEKTGDDGRLKQSTNKSAAALVSGQLQQAAASLGNAFEPVVFERYPGLPALKNRLLELGSWACHLTGSGPTFYALVSDCEMAHYIRRRIMLDEMEGRTPWNVNGDLTLDCFIAQSTSSGASIVNELVN